MLRLCRGLERRQGWAAALVSRFYSCKLLGLRGPLRGLLHASSATAEDPQAQQRAFQQQRSFVIGAQLSPRDPPTLHSLPTAAQSKRVLIGIPSRVDSRRRWLTQAGITVAFGTAQCGQT